MSIKYVPLLKLDIFCLLFPSTAIPLSPKSYGQGKWLYIQISGTYHGQVVRSNTLPLINLSDIGITQREGLR